MNFNLTRPCDNCPFRSDVVPYIEPTRALEIACDLERQSFACYKTVHCPQPRDAAGRFLRRIHSHCAGSLVIMEKINWRGDMQQIAARFGWYKPDAMDLSSPVYDSFDAFVEAHGLDFRHFRPRRGFMLDHLPRIKKLIRIY